MEQCTKLWLCFSSSNNTTCSHCYYFYMYIKPFLFYVITPGLAQSGEEKAWGDLIAAFYGEERRWSRSWSQVLNGGVQWEDKRQWTEV